MNMAISFFVGCVVFVMMMFIKIPTKRFCKRFAGKIGKSDEEKQLLYRRLNVVIIFLTMVLSMIVYYLVLLVMGETHFKMCCSLKAGAIAVAIYMIFEQWFGDDFQI